MKIGISGHQNIGCAETEAWVRQQLVQYLASHNVSTGISSLALGADQLFADIVLAMGKLLEVVVPCAAYEKTFPNRDDLSAYRALLGRATTKHVLRFSEPSEDAFYAAGRFVVDRSDAMVLVWNGKPAAGRGGTGDVASYVIERQRPAYWINPVTTTAQLLQVRGGA
jgi:hypothetical protein